MRTAKLGEEVIEDFKVTDSYHTAVTGLTLGSFDVKIYNASGTDQFSTVSPNLQELGDGNYRLKFTPDIKGMWSVIVKHTSYFPFGKGNDIMVNDYDMNDVGDSLKRILGLTQENYYVYDTVYDVDLNMTSSKIRIYEDGATIGGTTDIIAEYNVTATYGSNGRMDTYSVEKV